MCTVAQSHESAPMLQISLQNQESLQHRTLRQHESKLVVQPILRASLESLDEMWLYEQNRSAAVEAKAQSQGSVSAHALKWNGRGSIARLCIRAIYIVIYPAVDPVKIT